MRRTRLADGQRATLGRWLLALTLALGARTPAQVGVPGATPSAEPRAAAPLDLTGYWVSVVTEDWRYRMVTPDKGDFPGLPLNAAARALANRWNPQEDIASGNECKAYGAAAIMRVPTRLHISWSDAQTLKVETDAGTQTRLLHFGGTPPPAAAPSWQGYSVASWEGLRPRGQGLTVVAGTGQRPAPEGYLKIITTQLRPGYLRKNGVPYGAGASVEEYFDSFKEPNGDVWLVVTAIVSDPQYLDQPYITSSQFKKLADGSGWHPTPCAAQ
jgi:hypothetical protein